MVTNERTRDARRRQDDATGLAIAGPAPETLGRAGEELLDAADKAIRRALSRDSEAFLHANRQEGGQ